MTVSEHEIIGKLETPRNEAVFKRTHDAVLAATKERRQQKLNAQFHLDPTYPRQYPEEAEVRKNEFLRDKQGLNIGERFDLALHEKYFGKVDIVELASTDHCIPNASRRMFDEMNDFLEWFRHNVEVFPIEHDGEVIESYISASVGDDSPAETISGSDDPGSPADRLRSGRWMDYYYYGSEQDGPDGHRAVITRVRPFIMARAMVRGVACDIYAYKETVVTIPAGVLRELLMFDQQRAGSDQGVYPETGEQFDKSYHMSLVTMHQIEHMMYGMDGKVDRIHTAIFSAAIPVDHTV